MKKLLSFIAIAVLGITTTFAQTAVSVPATKKSAKKVTIVKATPVKVTKTEVKATTPVVVKKGTTSTAVNGVKVKADGSADMRYKENKNTKPVVVGPKKKDGTADMRYKANKPVTKKTKS